MNDSTSTSAAVRHSDAADAALETKISETVRDLRDGAVDIVRAGAKSADAATVAARQQVGKRASAGRDYVAREPFKSALFAAGFGAAVAAVGMAVFRSRQQAGGRS